jgi:nucleolar protein 14
MFSSKAEASAGQEGVIAAGVLNSAYSLLSDVVTIFQSSSALPEIVAPVVQTLRSVRPQSNPAAFPVWAQERHLSVLERIMGLSEKIRSTRQFLQWRKAATTSIEMKTPRFQLDYTFKKDIDPDQDRAKVKQLTRQLKREKKAAMRELRRDSDFIDQERYKEQQEAKEFRRAERVKNFAFMEEQQATINLQVRKGNGLMTGGGSGVAKKARVKRM